jgi:hypothetical protein
MAQKHKEFFVGVGFGSRSSTDTLSANKRKKKVWDLEDCCIIKNGL